MHTLIVTFQLTGLSPEAYAAHCAHVAPHFVALPGLIAKIWLADPASNTYGGVYLWASREALKAYLASETFNGIQTNAHFANVVARSFASLPAATAQTAGPLATISA